MSFYRPSSPCCIVVLLYATGCTSDPPRSSDPTSFVRNGENAELVDSIPPSITLDARPAAIVNGQSVSFGDIRPALSEASGGIVLEEHILDVQLRRALADAGLFVTERDRERERERLLETMSGDPDQAARLLRALRARRGLGPTRFDALLFRTAALRRLVAPRVRITDQAVRVMFDILHGEQRQSRIITFPNLQAARATFDDLGRGGDFVRLATERSTDQSAARGGLLEPMSRRDPAYADALRTAVFETPVGSYSSPILVDGTYVIVFVEAVQPPRDTTLEEARDEVVDAVRLNQERLLMAQLANELLNDASVTVFDRSLEASWKVRAQTADDLLSP